MRENLRVFLKNACKDSVLNSKSLDSLVQEHSDGLSSTGKGCLLREQNKTGEDLHYYVCPQTQRILLNKPELTIKGFAGTIFMTTVWHTGTVYTLKALRKKYTVKFQHCFPDALTHARECDWLITTYRDPLRTAASWANRDKIRHPQPYQGWFTQWDTYKELLTLNPTIFYTGSGRMQHGEWLRPEPLNTSKDRLKLHAALDCGDMDYYYRHVPKEMIDYALEKVPPESLSSRSVVMPACKQHRS